VQPSTPGTHLTVLNSTNLVNAAHWAAHDVHVTRRKDSEPRSSNPYQNQDTHRPPVDFRAFFDSEGLDQQDVVLWVNLGMHHVPTTADLPNTVTTTAHAGVKFVPSNYFDLDLSRRTRSTVRINYASGAVNHVEKGEREQVCEADLWNYRGDVVVRKYPFDPNNPYYGTSGIGG
jgi:primary-amine oxidase